MVNQLFVKVLFLSIFFSLSSCSLFSSEDYEVSSQNERNELRPAAKYRQDSVNDISVVEMQKHIEEWKKVKPSIERLVGIESELRELIVELNTMTSTDNHTVSKEMSSLPSDTIDLADYYDPPSQQTTILSPAKIYNTDKTANLINTQSILSNKFAVQLYSLTDKSALLVTWNELLQKHPSLLKGLLPVYEEVNVKGNIFYRVKAGPLISKSDVNQLCNQLKAVGTPCFTSTYIGTPVL